MSFWNLKQRFKWMSMKKVCRINNISIKLSINIYVKTFCFKLEVFFRSSFYEVFALQMGAASNTAGKSAFDEKNMLRHLLTSLVALLMAFKSLALKLSQIFWQSFVWLASGDFLLQPHNYATRRQRIKNKTTARVHFQITRYRIPL